MLPKIKRDVVEAKISTMQKKSYNRYYWWRRYSYRNELPGLQTTHSKIINGEFEISDYYYQAAHELYLLEDSIKEAKNLEEKHEHNKLYMERFRRLTVDFEKDEANIMSDMKKEFKRAFGITSEQMDNEMENFDGTTLELYSYIKGKYKK